MPKAESVLSTPRSTTSQFLINVNRLQLSLLIRDPFVRDAFERAERDGLAPMPMPVNRSPVLDSGAAEALRADYEMVL